MWAAMAVTIVYDALNFYLIKKMSLAENQVSLVSNFLSDDKFLIE